MPLSQEVVHVYCSYCGKNEVIKFGSYQGTPRYFCKVCGRKFKNDNCMFHMSVPVPYIEYVLNSYYSDIKISNIRENMKIKYDYCPSSALVRLWVKKYTSRACEMLKDYRPAVGRTWALNEIILMLNKRRFWVYEIMDDRTNYILQLEMFLEGKPSFKAIINKVREKTGVTPENIMVYIPISRFKEAVKGSGYAFQHVPKETYADRHRIGITGHPEIYDTQIYRIKNENNIRTQKTAAEYFEGLQIHHNYFWTDKILNGRTPAEAAGIDYPWHRWGELIVSSCGVIPNSYH
jgi:transposase-like protein